MPRKTEVGRMRSKSRLKHRTRDNGGAIGTQRQGECYRHENKRGANFVGVRLSHHLEMHKEQTDGWTQRSNM